MPKQGPIVFLAGHGAVSRMKTLVNDQALGSYHVIFPAKIRGQLCFVAHNILLQGLINSTDLYNELEKIESYYGISTVDISDGKVTEFKLLDELEICTIDFGNQKHRYHLQMFLQSVKDIALALDYIERVNDKMPNLFPEIEPNLALLQTVIFESVRLPFCFGAPERIKKMIHNIEFLLAQHTDIGTDKACMLLEHKLGSWDESMARMPWQRDMHYHPIKSGYDKHTLMLFPYTNSELSFYIDKSKITNNIVHPTRSISAEVGFNDASIQDGLFYVTTSAQEPVLLSEILKLLHKTHIYVSIQNDTHEALIRGVFAVEAGGAEDIVPSTFEFNNEVAQQFTWYDFTLADDVNVVWGACRDVQDF